MRTTAFIACALSALAFPTNGAEAQDRSILSILDTGGRAVAVAAAQPGTLSSSDLLSAGGRRVQAWSFSGSQGDELQFDLRSDDFDAFIYVVGPGLGEGLRDDDSGEGLNSRLCVVLQQSGEYRVVASSLSGGTGDFSLEVSAQPGVRDGVCPDESEGYEVTDLAQLPTESRTLSVGEDVEGSLGPSDVSVFGASAQAWAVQGRAGVPFSVDLISEAFDAFLYAQGPGMDEWLENDDGAGRCDSRLTFVFPEDGLYRIVVTSLGAGSGSYRLVTSREPGPPHPDPCLGAVAEPSASIEGVEVGASLEPEVTYDGTMTGNEGRIDERYVQAWSLQGRAGDRWAIELRSDDFDTYVYLAGPGFPALLSDDDGAGDLDSRLCVQLPEDGEYTVYGGPYSEQRAGERFTVRATMSDAEALCSSFEMSAAERAAALAELSTEGRSIGIEEQFAFLEPSGPRHPETDRTIQAWALDVPAGQEVTVDVVSEEFDPVLHIVGPGLAEALFADDSEDGGCNARLTFVSGGAGTVLLPGAYYNGASGNYLLRVSTDPSALEAGGCISPDTDSGVQATGDPGSLDHLSSGVDRRIAVGTEVEGSLGSSDEALESGNPAQTWAVDVRAGDELVFELLSDDFDPVLYLDAGGTLGPIMNDDGAGSLNSRIVYTPTLDTTIRLVVTALTTDGSGSFRLRAIRRTR